MTDTCLNLITQLTVELHKDDPSKEKLGTGVLYTDRKLSGVAYVLTAKHCLSKLGEKGRVSLRIYNPDTSTYEYLTPVKQSILLHPVDDAGIIIINKRELTSVVSDLPSVYVVDKIFGTDEAVSKGFPMATLDQNNENGESSLAMIRMTYLHEDTTENVFQLSTMMIIVKIQLSECQVPVFL